MKTKLKRILIGTLIGGLAGVALEVFNASCDFHFAPPLLLFAVMPNWWAALAVMVVLGGCMSAFQSLNSALVLSIADMEYHGRVQSLIMYSYSAFGLAALPFGMLADRAGLRETLTGMAVAVLVATVLFDRWRRAIAPSQIVSL